MIQKATREAAREVTREVKSYLNWVCVLLFFISSSALANVGDFLGFGARTMALGGAGVAGGTGPFAAYHNPAGLAFESKERLFFSWGLAYIHPAFIPIDNVVTDNAFTGTKSVNGGVVTLSGDVDTSYRDTFGQTLGLSYKLFPDFAQLTFGVVAFLPVNQLAYMDSGQPYIPEYVLYRSRTQRPQFEVGVGLKLSEYFSVGAGLHTGFGVTGNANVFLNTQANTTSTMTFAASLKPKFTFYLGGLASFGGESKPWNVGLVVRQASSSDLTLPLSAGTRALGDASLEFRFVGNSILFYDPATVELGTSWKSGAFTAVAQLDYQLWSGFQGPALAMSQPTLPNGDTASFNPGVVPSYQTVNLLVPRIGGEVRLNKVNSLRLGYSYRSSILKVVSNGIGNYLDPPKHVVTAGWGLDFDTFIGFKVPSHIDFALNFQQLVSQVITKTAGNEAGVQSDQKIGYPGYTAGGRLYGGAVTLALAF